ncbi:hypothetical protein niasHT_007724 [Heterodera trifolii]|uniref:Secretory carrier-associated membrane protein n=1 Tax=Heterodera trifolii TaxID=157864 RepID=A0ABD2MA99_9BILA
MSKLDENPFSDPFKDPAVQRVVSPAASVGNNSTSQSVIEEYNPFAPSASAGQAAHSTPPAVSMGQDELFRRQEELSKREQEQNRRQQTQPQANGVGFGAQNRDHNWPPLPSIVPLKPCFYQDIDVEIPQQFQETVRWVYHVYLLYVLALAFNLVASLLFVLFAGGPIGLPFLAVIQLALFTPCAFLLWFRPVYKAFRDDSSFNFLVFFLVLFLHTIFCFIQALGLSEYACGWSDTLSIIRTHFFVGLVMLCSAAFFSLAFVGMCLSLIKVHRWYRGAGFSFDKARQEFSSGVMSDRNVQQAANQAARAAAAHAVNEMTGGRY